MLNSARIVGDTLVVEGNRFNNRIEITDAEANPNIIEIEFGTFEFGPDFEFNRSQFNKLKVDGKKGDDDIVFDLTVDLEEPVTIIGGEGDDEFRGTDRSDTFIPGAGNDRIIRSPGGDRIIGIEGDDVYEFQSEFFGGGIDLLDMSGHARGFTLDISNPQRQVIDSAGNAVRITGPLENVTGSAFADSITGNELVNRLEGGNGNDTLFGLAENDRLLGGIGHDELDGGEGADRLDGDDGNDGLHGGDGDDRLEGDEGNDRLFGDGQSDTLRGGDDSERLDGGSGDDIYQLFDRGVQRVSDTLGGIDTLDFRFAPGNVTVDLSILRARQDVGAGLFLTLGGTLENVIGSPFARNNLTGNAANNRLSGGFQIDVLRGGAGDDELDGNLNNDSLFGEAGNDRLIDGFGDDTLEGGLDDDVYVLTPGSADTVSDTGGVDELDFAGSARGITLTLELMAGEVQIVDTFGNTIALIGEIEDVRGSEFNDDITGNVAANFLAGGAGDDVLRGGAGNDRLLGDRDNDNLRGQADEDQLFGGDGDDILNGGGNSDVLQGGVGNDLLEGVGGDDQLAGQGGSDTLLGGTGDDSIELSANIDIAQGEAGFDTVTLLAPFTTSAKLVTVDLDPATGELVINGSAASPFPPEAHRAATVERLEVFTSFGDDNIDLSAISAADLAAANLTGVTVGAGPGTDTVKGTPGADIINGDDGGDIIEGGDGDDQISGGSGDDDLFGDDGNDTVSGDAGDDNVVGGDGDDTLFGGDDDDVVLGGEGNDVLDGGAGNNILDGGPGQDGVVFYGTAGNDRINVRRQFGPGGAQVVFEINGQVTVEDYRNGETVFIFAGDGNDQVAMDSSAGVTWNAEFHGQGGHDQLTGAQRNDLLDGGEGNDLLFGLAGRDTFIGGPGLDIIFATDGEIDRIVAEVFDVVLKDANDTVA